MSKLEKTSASHSASDQHVSMFSPKWLGGGGQLGGYGGGGGEQEGGSRSGSPTSLHTEHQVISSADREQSECRY